MRIEMRWQRWPWPLDFDIRYFPTYRLVEKYCSLIFELEI